MPYSLRSLRRCLASLCFTVFTGTLVDTAFLTTAQAQEPVISSGPQNRVVAAGNTSTLGVQAIGSEPLLYQWFRNGQPLAGATNALLNFPATRAQDAGLYHVVVSNGFGSVTSAIASLTFLATNAPPAGLVGWWRGEGNAHDESGLNPGSLVNGSGFVDGLAGRAFRFEASQHQQVAMADSSTLRFATNFTFEAWIRPRAVSPVGQAIFSKVGVGTESYQVGVDSQYASMSFIAEGESWGANLLGAPFAATLPTNRWTHVAWSYGNGWEKIHVNGELAGSLFVGQKTIAQRSSSFRISGDENNAFFEGDVDEPAAWNRELPSDEILAHYQAGGAGYLATRPFIATQPQSQTVAAGSSTSLSVSLSGSLASGFQWLRNGQPLAGATNGALTITNSQPANVGNYFVIVSNSFGSVTSQVARLEVETTLTRLTNSAVEGTIGTTGYSTSLVDYDNDGFPDITFADRGGTVMFRNQGAGTFARVTNSVSGVSADLGVWGDYDRDGAPDLFLGTASVGGTDHLFRNDGAGQFSAVSAGDLTGIGGQNQGASWADFDNDGWLDLAVGGGWSTPLRVSRNNANGNFSARPGIPNVAAGPMAVGDYDDDGDADLVATGAVGLMLRNDGTNFVQITTPPASSLGGDVDGATWGDFDNDGDLDLVLVGTAFTTPTRLFRNDGTNFVDVAQPQFPYILDLSVGADWGDYDNDGWLDLFVSSATTNNWLLHNSANGSFTLATYSPALGNTDGGAWGDLDRDGFLDLVVSRENRIYHNNGNINAWLGIRCIGTASNRLGIGAKVRVLANLAGLARWQLREISGGSSIGTQGPLEAHFGLGDATNIDLLRIEWPSGAVQEHRGLAPRQFLTIVETNEVFTPTNNRVIAGSTLRLKASLEWPTGTTFQWRRDGTNILGATNALFTVPSFGSNHLAAYQLVVSNDSTYLVSARWTPVLASFETDFTAVTNTPLAGRLCYGPTWVDFDQDGKLDLFAAAAGAATPESWLYRNTGSGFEVVLPGPKEEGLWQTTGGVWGDFDNDGRIDVFVVRQGAPLAFYRNLGPGGLARVVAWGGENDPAGTYAGATAADYDRDGYLDLLVATWNGANDVLFRNLGNGTFSKVTTGALVENSGWSYTGAWADYNNDGWPDLLVANRGETGSGGSPNFLFSNGGDSGFTRVTGPDSILTDVSYSTGAAWADYDNDGDLDVFVIKDLGQNNTLYRNDGLNGFTRVTGDPVVSGGGNSQGCAWGDYDNDGWLDLFVANYFDDAGGNMLYHNNGNGTFTRVLTEVIGGDTNPAESYGCAWGDYDNDGFLDLVVGDFNRMTTHLYRNAGNNRAWLKVRCTGAASNRSAIGAKVRIQAVGAGAAAQQMREIFGGSGFSSQNDLVQHFGLGEATNVESVVVEWPSGRISELHNVRPNQTLDVYEPAELHLSSSGLGQITVQPPTTNYFAGQTLTLSAAPKNTNWTHFIAWSDGNTNPIRTITIGQANSYTAIFSNQIPIQTLPLKMWERDYGGTGDDAWGGYALQTADGGFILAASSDSGVSGNKTSPNAGGYDFWILKLDAQGQLEWEATYGGVSDDYLNAVRQTTDGGYILAGTTYSGANGNKTTPNYGGGRDGWIIKLDSLGNKIWEQDFGGTGIDVFYSVEQTSDGGYILGGASSSGPSGNKTSPNYGSYDFWLVRIDSGGTKLWEQSYGGSGEDIIQSILQMPDGGFLVGDYSLSAATGNKTSPNYGGLGDAWIIRVDKNGIKHGESHHGGSGEDAVRIITGVADGGFALGGYSSSGSDGNKSAPNRGGSDVWLIKLDAQRNKVWEQTFGGDGWDEAICLRTKSDGGFLLGGRSASGLSGTKVTSGFGGFDFWFLGTDANGHQQFDHSLGGSGDDTQYSLIPLSDGGLALSGHSTSGLSGNKETPNFGANDLWLIKMALHEAPAGTPAILVHSSLGNERTNTFYTQSPVSVTMTSIWNGPIHFTLDGTDPDFSSAQYDPGNPPQVTPPAVVKAIAYLDDNYTASELYADYSEVVSTVLAYVPIYTLDLSLPGGGVVAMNPPGPAHLSNTVVTLVATNLPGWTFLGWQGDVTSTNPIVAVALNSNLTARAVFGTALATNATPAGTSIGRSPVLPLYPYGSSVRLTAITQTNRFLSTWTGALAGAISPQDLVITNANPVVGATFGTLAGANFGLMVQINGEGTVSYAPATNRFASNSVVTLTATPRPGWLFDRWTGGSNSTANPLALVLHTNKTITANFSANTGGNLPPNAVLTNPVAGQIFTFPTNILLQATATDSDGLVTAVSFFDGPSLLGLVTNPPYSMVLSNALVGGHTLTAVVLDNLGLAATSAPVTITVNPANQLPLVSLTSPTNNSLLTVGTNLPLAANAADPDGSIVRVEFYAGTNLLGVDTLVPYALTWSNVPAGAYALTAQAVDNAGAKSSSAPISIVVANLATNPPVFSWSNTLVQVEESAGSVTVHVLKSADSAAVPADIGIRSQNGTADTTDYGTVAGQLSFGVGELVKAVTIPIVQDSLVESNHYFFMVLDPPALGSMAGAAEARVTIVDDDLATTNSILVRVPPSALPSPLATLAVNLQPANVGQWRLSWENTWHDGGAQIAGLPPGDYELQFKPVSGYVEPLSTFVAVVTNTLNTFTFNYSNSEAPQLGSLLVQLNPSFVATNGDPNQRGQWRRVGEAGWHNSGEIVDALPAGSHVIEFKLLTAGSWQTPSTREITVLPNQLNSIVGEYFVANATPGVGPTLLSFASQVQNTFGLQRGYQFCGQLLTPLGWGSGTVVKQRVVLTAAHVVFDDYALAFVPNSAVRWFFQRQAGEYEPAPQIPRGFVVSSGYAAQRQAEASPGLAGVASRDLDLAALYFAEPAGRGGFSGYLVSKPGEEWLQIASSASLAGYPVEGVPAQDRGKMHRTIDQSVSWSVVSNQVYATTDLKSYPGNSGGPVLVQVNTIIPVDARASYWPAAVYLGGSGNTMVRAIDHMAVDLINEAEVLGNIGGNNTGGEPPRRASDCANCSPLIYGALEVSLTPANIGLTGGGYRFRNETGGTIYREAFNRFYVLANTPWTLEFLPAPYTIAPSNRTITTPAGRTNRTTGLYKSWGQIAIDGLTLRAIGTTGAVYRLDYKTNLNQAAWTPIRTQTLSGTGLPITNLPGGTSNGFIRAVLLP